MYRTMILTFVLASALAAVPPGGGSAPGEPQQPQAPAPPPATMGNGPATAASPNPAMLAQAKAAFAQLQSGNVDRTTLDSQMNAALTDDKLNAVKSAIGSLGTPTSFVELRSGSQDGYPFAVYAVTFANGTKLNFIFALDAQGKIGGMQLTPPQ